MAELGLDKLDKIDSPKVQEIIAWLRNNYTEIQQACEDKGLPKPPNW
jgi:hypothetical protein